MGQVLAARILFPNAFPNDLAEVPMPLAEESTYMPFQKGKDVRTFAAENNGRLIFVVFARRSHRAEWCKIHRLQKRNYYLTNRLLPERAVWNSIFSGSGEQQKVPRKEMEDNLRT